MKKLLCVFLFLILCVTASAAEGGKGKIILMITEQNISGPQRAWWASEIDLSATEAALAEELGKKGYEVVEPSAIAGVISRDQAFRLVRISNRKSADLGRAVQADYVVAGNAVATTGANVPHSKMVSCFANITVRLIRVEDGKMLTYIQGRGSVPHMEAVTGGTEALNNAARELAVKITDKLAEEQEGGAIQ